MHIHIELKPMSLAQQLPSFTVGSSPSFQRMLRVCWLIQAYIHILGPKSSSPTFRTWDFWNPTPHRSYPATALTLIPRSLKGLFSSTFYSTVLHGFKMVKGSPNLIDLIQSIHRSHGIHLVLLSLSWSGALSWWEPALCFRSISRAIPLS